MFYLEDTSLSEAMSSLRGVGVNNQESLCYGERKCLRFLALTNESSVEVWTPSSILLIAMFLNYNSLLL